MRRSLAVLFLFSIALALPTYARRHADANTAPGKYEEWGPNIDQIEIIKTFKFADYKKIVVVPVDATKATMPEKSDNSYEAARSVVATATDPLVAGMKEVLENADISVDNKPGKSAGTLIIRTRLLSMDPGSQAARMWVGYGAGAAGTKVEGDIVDAKSGEVLAKFTQERRSGNSWRGSGYDTMMNKNLHAIGEDVANILKAF
jgi:Domain of unknown function (DUF4410)